MDDKLVNGTLSDGGEAGAPSAPRRDSRTKRRWATALIVALTGLAVCLGVDLVLFASSAKFDSGTGWPSFATQLPAVAVEKSNLEFLAGAEIRCGRCGGHLGDRFLDGALFPGTAAAVSGQRYCVDGSATVFYPADGSTPVRGEFDPQKPRELPAWAQPPGIKVNG